MLIKEVSKDYIKFEKIFDCDKPIIKHSKIKLDCSRYFVIDDGYFTITREEYSDRLKAKDKKDKMVKKLIDKFGCKWVENHNLL